MHRTRAAVTAYVVAIAAAALVRPGAVWPQGATQGAPPLPYNAPSLALVQPSPGGSVADDRPVIFFRFAPGETADPIDLGSFSIAVDGRDRTALFRIVAPDSWGPLGANGIVEPGPHDVVARICSARGACAVVETRVIATTAPTAGASDGDVSGGTDRRKRVIDVLLTVARKLLAPTSD